MPRNDCTSLRWKRGRHPRRSPFAAPRQAPRPAAAADPNEGASLPTRPLVLGALTLGLSIAANAKTSLVIAALAALAERYCQVLEHKWYLSEKAQRDVGLEVAIEEGATQVRLGTAIFGERGK